MAEQYESHGSPNGVPDASIRGLVCRRGACAHFEAVHPRPRSGRIFSVRECRHGGRWTTTVEMGKPDGESVRNLNWRSLRRFRNELIAGFRAELA